MAETADTGNTDTPTEDTDVQETQTTPVVDGEETAPAEQPTTTHDAPGEDTAQEAAEITKIRKEAAKYRTTLRDTEARLAEREKEFNTLLKGLSQLTGEGSEEVSPEEQLAAALKERDQAQQRLRELTQDNAVRQAAVKHGADADLITPYLKGSGALDALDPGTDDYQAQVAELIAETVEKHPQLRTQVVARTSGQAPNPTPENNAGGKLSHADIKALAAAGKWDEINKAAAEGRIRS